MAGNEVRERSRLQSFWHVSLQGILLTSLLIAPWFYGLTRFGDQLLAQVFIFTFFLVSVPFLGEKQAVFSIRNSFDGWVFLSLGIGFCYVLFSALPYPSLLTFLRFLSCVVFYGLVRWAVRTDRAFGIFLWAILTMGFFYSSYGLLQYYGFLPHPFWYQPFSLASRYVNGGHFAVLLLFPLFVGISLLASCRKVFFQGILIFFLLVIGWALLLTRSRAVWIAFSVGFVLFVSLGKQTRFLSKGTISGTLLLVGLGGLLFLSQGGFEEIRRRFGDLWGMRFYSLVYRGQLWTGALSAIADRPWGWGLGTFSSVFPQYRVHADRFFVDYAHNEFLQVGVELGIPGVLFLIGFLWFYLQRSFSLLKRERIPSSQRTIAAGFLALWISLILVSQVDFPLRIYATGILFASFLGLSAYLFEPLRGGERERRDKKGFWIIPWLAVLISNLLTTRQLFADLHFNEGKRLEENLSWVKAHSEYEMAVRLTPLFSRYQEALGFLSERRAKVTFDPAQRKILLKKAIQAYQEASRLEPYRALTHYLLASLYEEEGEFLRAQAEFLKAAALEPTNAVFLAEYGHFALRHSLVDEAIEAFEKVKNLPFHGAARSDYGEILKLCYRFTQDYNQLRRVIPDDVFGHFSLAPFMAESGQWDHAREEFEAAMEKAKETSEKWFEDTTRHVAEFYDSHSRFQEALEIYQEMAVRNPQNEEIKRKIEELHGHLSGA